MSAISTRISKLEQLQASQGAVTTHGVPDRELMRIILGGDVTEEALDAHMVQFETTGVIPWDSSAIDGGGK